jgi:hypothetical protein
MNLLSLPIEIQRLAQIGDDEVLDTDIWTDYFKLGIRDEHIPALMEILENIADFSRSDADDPTGYLPMHSWRALVSLKADIAIPLMVSLLDRDDVDNDTLISEELPHALGKMGPAVYPALSLVLKNKTHGRWARNDAAEAMAIYATHHPEDRLRVINDLSDVLADYQTADPVDNAILIELLGKLKAIEAAPLVEQVYSSDRVDQAFIGDYEDFQVNVGLLNARLTAPNNSPISPLSFMDGFSGVSIPPGKTKEDSKTKKKRKQAEQTRKANRPRHKKKK